MELMCHYIPMNELKLNGSIGYCIAGKEIAPITGTPHIQGYIRFTDKKGKCMKTVIRVLGYFIETHGYARMGIHFWMECIMGSQQMALVP